MRERGAGLSVGQKQLIAFARAVAFNPALLLVLDEATANVDTETEWLIQQALGRLMEGRTSIVIAHRLSTIREVDRIIVLHKGQIVEQGTHDDLLQHHGIYARLYELQYRDQETSIPQPLSPAGLRRPPEFDERLCHAPGCDFEERVTQLTHQPGRDCPKSHRWICELPRNSAAVGRLERRWNGANARVVAMRDAVCLQPGRANPPGPARSRMPRRRPGKPARSASVSRSQRPGVDPVGRAAAGSRTRVEGQVARGELGDFVVAAVAVEKKRPEAADDQRLSEVHRTR